MHAAAAAAKSLQSCPTLCDPIDGSPSGSPIPGILQARTLEWVCIKLYGASLVAQLVKNPPAMRETWVGKIPWRREKLPHSSILAWRIPWTV